MKTKTILIIAVLLGAVVAVADPAFPLAYRFDFDGDEVWDTSWILEPPPAGETVELEVWLDQNYTCPPVDNLFGVALYFSYDPGKLQVNQIIPNDALYGGPFDSQLTILNAPLCSGGVCVIEVANFSFVTVSGNKILLFTVELEAIGSDVAAVQASDNVGPPYNDGFIFDCNVSQLLRSRVNDQRAVRKDILDPIHIHDEETGDRRPFLSGFDHLQRRTNRIGR